MFELLVVLALVLGGMILAVGFLKFMLGLLLLPVKIIGGVLHLLVSLAVGVIGIAIAVVLLPVVLILVPVVMILCVLAVPCLLAWGLFCLVF